GQFSAAADPAGPRRLTTAHPAVAGTSSVAAAARIALTLTGPGGEHRLVVADPRGVPARVSRNAQLDQPGERWIGVRHRFDVVGVLGHLVDTRLYQPRALVRR